MSNKSKHPRCPLCGGKSQEAKGGGFQCTAPLCGGFFDSKPNEGGDGCGRICDACFEPETMCGCDIQDVRVTENE